MSRLSIRTEITAPVERVFDLSMSIDLHTRSMAHTGERAVAGVTCGIIRLGEEVTWQARHFGVRQRLSSRITICERPHRFRDTMLRGAFKRLEHDHLFEQRGAVTVVTDIIDFTAPLWILGVIADRLVLRGYLRRLIERRNAIVKRYAESEDWKTLPGFTP